jgi:hypothetical protein
LLTQSLEVTGLAAEIATPQPLFRAAAMTTGAKCLKCRKYPLSGVRGMGGNFSNELRNAKGTSKSMILVPLFDLKVLIKFAAVTQDLQIGGTRVMHIALARALLPSLSIMHLVCATFENSQVLWQSRSMKWTAQAATSARPIANSPAG